MPRYEDPSEDPAVIEAIVNIKEAIRHISPIAEWASTGGPYSELLAAMTCLEHAVRFLEGKEDQS